MGLIKLAPQAGLFRDGSRYSAEGQWYDCDKIRFRKGFPEKLGGWQKYVSGTFQGSCRYTHDWGTIKGARYVGLGTNLKLYLNEGSSYHDITPIRSIDAITLGTDPITTTINSGVISVAHASHGVVIGDYVTFAGATDTNGITSNFLNVELRVDSIPDANTFTALVGIQATSSGTGGGSIIVSSPQINTGLDTFVGGTGWGADSWGSGSWGAGSTISSANQLRLWSLDNFGDDMIVSVFQGGMYYWDESNGTSTRAIQMDELIRRTVTLTNDPVTTVMSSNIITIKDTGGHGAGPGDIVTISGAAAVGGVPAGDINQEQTIVLTPTNTTFTIQVATSASSATVGGGALVQAIYNAGRHFTPTISIKTMVSNTARHIIAFGCNEVGSADLNPLLVRWCSSENAADWEPRDNNSAGGQPLSTGSTIVGAIRTRQEHIIWTDSGMVSMRYSGAPFYFSFTEITKNVSMISLNAAVNANGSIYFMDRGGFYMYSGSVQRIICPIRDFIFTDLDLGQAQKIVSGTNVDFSEVFWFYPSKSGGGDNDKYVKYNYDENAWDFGTLIRGFWSDAPTKTFPLASSLNLPALGIDPIATVNTSPVITITVTAHGVVSGDLIILKGVSAVGGLSTAVLNTRHVVVTAVNADSFTVSVIDDATSTATGGGGIAQIRLPNVLYSHEKGHDDDGLAMTSFIESADFDMGDGDRFIFAHRIIPDIDFRDNTDPGAVVTLSLQGHNYPGQAQSELSTSDIMPATEQSFIRVRTRQLALRAESTGIGYGWRLGHTRLDVREDGAR